MKIIICSNSAFAPTGYGTQTKFLAEAFQQLGHEVYIVPNWGVTGAAVKIDGVRYLPPFRDQWASDIIGNHAKSVGADVVLSHHDVWTLRPDWPRSFSVPWITYSPVDTEPLSPRLATILREARHVVAMSRFGQTQMAHAGIASTYIPHAINAEAYRPGDRAAARAKLGVSPDKFVVLIAAANQGYPARKAFPEQMAAFAAFHQEFPDTELLLHTAMTPTNQLGGLDLYDLVRSLGLYGCTANTEEYDIAMGVSDEHMALIYRSADVLLGASYAEGFGLMQAESQACGTPAIVHDFAASPEFLYSGIKVPSVQRFWTLLGSWYAIPSIPAITQALREIYLNKPRFHDDAIIAADRVRADLSHQTVRDQYWKPFLDSVEDGFGRRWLRNILPPVGPNPSVEAKKNTVVQPSTSIGDFTTPRGKAVRMWYRSDTNDWNTISASMTHDEYRLAELPLLTGVALDVGAYVGSVAVALALDNPELQVICVEPVPENVEMIRRNIDLNNLSSRIRVIEGAVGGPDDESTTISWGYVGDAGLEHHAFVGNTTLVYEHGASHLPHQEANAQCYSLTKLLEIAGVDALGLLKIDCEGAEWAALSDRAVKRIDRIVGEWHNVSPRCLSGTGATQTALVNMLPNHALTFSGPETGPGGFSAVRVTRPARASYEQSRRRSKRVLLLLAHSIEEYDMMRLLTESGYDVFSIGAYSTPRSPADKKRPALPDAPDHPGLREACERRRKERGEGLILTPHGLRNPVDWAKADLPDELLGWADTVICHHFEHTWLVPQWEKLRASSNRIIWRTVGQSSAHNEEMMAPLVKDGLEVIRYSPKERNIPGYCGETDMVRFYKSPEEWDGWIGDSLDVINITQHLQTRDPYTNYQFWQAATAGLPSVAAGPGSKEIGGVGELSYDDMRGLLRRSRAYLYTGTQPASYTLGLIEALMTGIPVVSIGPKHMNVFPYGPELFEGHELCQLWTDDPVEANDMLRRLLHDWNYAREISKTQRAVAIATFGRSVVAEAWKRILDANTR